MLILSRKRNEQIIIGDGIVITIVAVRGGSVRIGIEAPSDISVHRQEIYDAIREGKIEEKPRAGRDIPPSSTPASGVE